MSTFEPAIVDYICKKLQEGLNDAAILEEVTDSTDPLFTTICGDLGIATDYLVHARTKGPHPG